MIAFNIQTGEVFWEFEFLFNNFSRPLIVDDQLIFTTGEHMPRWAMEKEQATSIFSTKKVAQ